MQSRKKKVYIFLTGWLPEQGPRSILNVRFVENINVHGYLFKYKSKNNLDDKFRGKFEIINTPKLYFKLLKKILFKLKLDIYSLPDLFSLWSIITTIKAAFIYTYDRPEIIISISKKDSSHIPALFLKVLNKKLKWLTFFYDPWEYFNFTKKEYPNKIFNKIDHALAKNVYMKCDKIFVTNQKTAELIISTCPKIDKNKFVIRKHNFNELKSNLILNKQKRNILKSKINISHVGDLYGNRSPKPILDAIIRLHSDGYIRNNLSLNFCGRFFSKDRDECFSIIDRFDFIKYQDRTSFEDSLKKIVNADILLVIEGDEYNLPYKLTEYIGMRKIIWGIGKLDGALYLEMKEWNSLFSNIDDPKDIYSKLFAILSTKMGEIEEKYSVPEDIRNSFSTKEAFKTINSYL